MMLGLGNQFLLAVTVATWCVLNVTGTSATQGAESTTSELPLLPPRAATQDSAATRNAATLAKFGASAFGTGAFNGTQRDLQSEDGGGAPGTGLTYWANYTVDFQVIQDSYCSGSAPNLQIYCISPYIEVINVSHPAIECDPTRRVNFAGWTYLDCTVTCGPDDDDCDASTIYQASDGEPGPFGSIEYSCTSTNLNAVLGQVSFLGTQEGGCVATFDVAKTRMAHILRMGVLCPSDLDDGETGDKSPLVSSPNQRYSYDDYFFECYQELYAVALNNEYTCSKYQRCNGQTCAANISNVDIIPYLEQFQDLCVSTSSASTVVPPAPTPPPVALDVESSTSFSVIFKASWSLLIQPESSDCTGSTPTIVVECQNGRVELVSTSIDGIACSDIDESSMECEAGDETDANPNTVGAAAVNSFVSVYYKCTGPVLPQSNVRFASGQASCDANTVETKISHAVQLELLCDSIFSGTTDAIGIEGLVECGDPSHDLDFLDAFGNTAVNAQGPIKLSCRESVTFGTSSSASAAKEIPIVEAMTDPFWEIGPTKYCYNQTSGSGGAGSSDGSTSSSATDSPASNPTISPMAEAADTPSPTVETNSSATGANQAAPTVSSAALPPASVPNSGATATVPATPAPNAEIESVGEPSGSSNSSNNGESGLPVGGIVGAVVAILTLMGVAATGAVCWMKKQNQPATTSATGKPSVHGREGSTSHDPSEGDVGGGRHSTATTTTATGSSYATHASHYQPDVHMNPYNPPYQPNYHDAGHQPPFTSPDLGAPTGSFHPQNQQPPHGRADDNYTGNGAFMHPSLSVSPHRQQQQAQSEASFQHPSLSLTPIDQFAARPQPPPQPQHQHKVNFKDQARSVLYEVPMMDVQPVMATEVHVATAKPYEPQSLRAVRGASRYGNAASSDNGDEVEA